jgi:hypothetical protein
VTRGYYIFTTIEQHETQGEKVLYFNPFIPQEKQALHHSTIGVGQKFRKLLLDPSELQPQQTPLQQF